MPRIFKQLFIGSVYLLIIFGIAYGVYDSTRVQPTCTDKIQNQGEQGVDCGVVCGNLCAPAIVPLQVKDVQIFKEGSKYDFLATIANSNALYGSGEVAYQIDYLDSTGQVISMATGVTY